MKRKGIKTSPSRKVFLVLNYLLLLAVTLIWYSIHSGIL